MVWVKLNPNVFRPGRGQPAMRIESMETLQGKVRSQLQTTPAIRFLSPP
jgi:hypothetical protein